MAGRSIGRPHLQQKPALRFTKQYDSIFGNFVTRYRLQIEGHPQPTSKGHLGCRNAQATFTEIMAGPYQGPG